ncbi:MAG: NAD(P)-dependent oxidoreductase [Balneolaceae bacterium]|nr:NAD(P)-dependent oxidoreductase [Balneolaceae bacterium]
MTSKKETKKNNDTPKGDSPKKILIVGGAGYIGGYLTDLLDHNGFEVVVYDNLIYEDRFMKKIPFVYGDIRDTDKLSEIINDFDVVIWLAAIVGDGACSLDPDLTKKINLTSVEWLVENYNGKIVFTSTCSVYGASPNDSILQLEDTNPISLYATTKLEAEKILLSKAKDPLIFRLGTLFGIGDEHSRIRLDLVVNILTKKGTLGEPLTVYGGGQWRPLLHVKDVAEAILFGIENDVDGLYNLSNKNYRIKDVAYEIQKVIPEVVISFYNVKFEDLRNYRVDPKRFKSFGWEPKHSLEKGILEIHKIIKEKRIKDPADFNYSNAAFLKNNPLGIL